MRQRLSSAVTGHRASRREPAQRRPPKHTTSSSTTTRYSQEPRSHPLSDVHNCSLQQQVLRSHPLSDVSDSVGSPQQSATASYVDAEVGGLAIAPSLVQEQGADSCILLQTHRSTPQQETRPSHVDRSDHHQQLAINTAQEIAGVEQQICVVAHNLAQEQAAHHILQEQHNALQQQADKLEWAVALLKLRKGTKGLAGNSNSGGSGSNDDGSTNSSGGTTNNSWFTSRMPTFGERAALTQAVQELAHQNALDEEEVAAVHAVLIAKTDVRVYAEMAMRDRLSARVAHLREQVAIAKDEAEDNAAELCGLRMQLTNLRRSNGTSAREQELQQLLQQQHALNAKLMQQQCKAAT